MHDRHLAHVSMTIHASRAAVWNALVDPATIARYLLGVTVISDWREGSPIVWRGEWQGRPFEDRGTIVRLSPENVLCYRQFISAAGPDDYHTVTITLSGEGGATRVTLTQDHNPNDEARQHAERNWATMLESLKRLLEADRHLDATEQSGPPDGPGRIDLAMVAAIGVLVYALANALHEGLGHGGTCVLVGGRPRALSSVAFECDMDALGSAARRAVAAGGTVVNLATAWLLFGMRRRWTKAAAHVRYFAWLAMTVNLLQGTGYLLFSGAGNLGDWAGFARGLGSPLGWRIGLTAAGAISYWFSVRLAMHMLGPQVGGDPNRRVRRASGLTMVPYVTGGALYCAAALLNPAGMVLLAVSAAAASLGGTSGLVWGPQLLRGRRFAGSDHPLTLPLRWRWVVAAAVVAVGFIAGLGPGIRFR